MVKVLTIALKNENATELTVAFLHIRFLKRNKTLEVRGFEPLAYRLRTYRSSQLSYTPDSHFILRLGRIVSNLSIRIKLYPRI